VCECWQEVKCEREDWSLSKQSQQHRADTTLLATAQLPIIVVLHTAHSSVFYSVYM
jgi:hypothetical protein